MQSISGEDFSFQSKEMSFSFAGKKRWERRELRSFEAEREKLIRSHEQNKVLLRREYLSKEVELEKEFEAALTELMEKYTPTAFPASNCNS